MKITFPVLIINAKTYTQATGKKATQLAQITQEIATKNNIILCPQSADLHRVSTIYPGVFAQHVDLQEAGSHTGKIHIDSLRENGAQGVLLNHSENRLSHEELMLSIALVQEARLTALVCVQTPQEAQAVAQLKPDIIAIEPPELIGGTQSISTAQPELITQSVRRVHKVNPDIPVLCGAGVSNEEDVKKALALGAQGVLIASGIIKAKHQKTTLKKIYKVLEASKKT